jgi:hypothetical protein
VIRFKCPYCGNAIEVGDADAGREGLCHGCGKRIKVPRPVIVVDDEAQLAPEAPGNGTPARPRR